MFANTDGMRAYLCARGWSLKNESLFVGRCYSFFTQQNTVYGLSSGAVTNGAPPELRGHVLKDGRMLLVFPAGETDIGSPEQMSFDFDVASAAEAWGIPELAFFPGTCAHVQEVESENPLKPELNS